MSNAPVLILVSRLENLLETARLNAAFGTTGQPMVDYIEDAARQLQQIKESL